MVNKFKRGNRWLNANQLKAYNAKLKADSPIVEIKPVTEQINKEDEIIVDNNDIRNALLERYAELYGKKCHPAISLEKLQDKVNEKLTK